MTTLTHSITLTADSAVSPRVQATEPAPGLRVYQIPDWVSPASPYRWTVGHHGGAAIASARTEDDALAVAAAIAPLADWSAPAPDVRAALGQDGMKELGRLVYAANGIYPND
ncbi:hypothetical protein D7231_32035 [Streptomyces klenkii]|uniref:Uncharacterized protein n=1 Tax=Streptomyces klenkii TaxID=1420899 RepID=A0A3B0AMZ2_9ACTN|nr:hypothetical protein [Streptomyces klenkii]RKN61903.1 hypothetical protein D7231_32035 [Streptomyces klenkii]